MKTNHKTMRITDEALSYIESFQGTSFNDKINNMIDYFQNSQPDLEKKLEIIKIEINNKKGILSNLIEHLNSFKNEISQINSYYNSLTK